MPEIIIVKGDGTPSAYKVVEDAGYTFLPLSDDPHRETFAKDGHRYHFAHPVWVWDGKQSFKFKDVRIFEVQ
jgi:hypothetical protein